MARWLGIVTSYDFLVNGQPAPNTVTAYLTPSAAAFGKKRMTADQKAAALQLYQVIYDQLTGPGVSFYLETNLALAADGSSLVQLPLTPAQTTSVVNLVQGMISFLEGTADSLPSQVALSVAVSGPGALPPAFEIAVLFGIQRDPTLISPLLKDADGNITFPSAQNVATTLAANVGTAPAQGDSPTDLGSFAAAFVQAFPALKMAVGLVGTEPAQAQSSTGRARKRLRSLGLAGDGTGGGRPGPQSLWAVQSVLLDIHIGAAANSGPRYLSPKPLDNALNSATVPLPALASPLPTLPTSQLFMDVDLDRLNQAFFQAVDNLLAPAAAAQAFEQASSAYQALAQGRQLLATGYASHEVDWLFEDGSPFTGTSDQQSAACDVFQQQMRASLMTAYSVDTLVQYDVAWASPLPPAADGMLALFGQVQAQLTGSFAQTGTTVTCTTTASHGLNPGDKVSMAFTPAQGQTAPPDGVYPVTVVSPTQFTVQAPTSASSSGSFTAVPLSSGLSTAQVQVSTTGPSLLTFLYAAPDVTDVAQVSFNLQFNVTHVEYYLTPKNQTPSDQARPSIWLQLVNPYPADGLPHLGPANSVTVIPVVYRQYPTPPTILSQSAVVGSTPSAPVSTGSNPFSTAAAWQYLVAYQAQLTAHDQIQSAITYNTALSAANGGTSGPDLGAAATGPFSLFVALARFTAAYDVLQPILVNLSHPNWAAAVQAFASCLTEVVQNTDWNPTTALAGSGPLQQITDNYVITDAVQANGARLITLAWAQTQGQSSLAGASITITALAPNTLEPYLGQNFTRPNGQPFETDTYQPQPPWSDDWVAHQVTVQGLNVLTAENALAGVQIERNLIALSADGQTSTCRSEFVYVTPLVRSSQPVTPFIDNNDAIDVACPASPSSLCQCLYTLMENLVGSGNGLTGLLAARAKAGLDQTAARRLKVACSYQYPVPAAAGLPAGSAPISPLLPVVLARSFVVDATQPDQLSEFAQAFANAIATWSTTNAVPFGPTSQPAGAQLVFDITLYAELSSLNTPVLRLSNLQLALTDIDPVSPSPART